MGRILGMHIKFHVGNEGNRPLAHKRKDKLKL